MLFAKVVDTRIYDKFIYFFTIQMHKATSKWRELNKVYKSCNFLSLLHQKHWTVLSRNHLFCILMENKLSWCKFFGQGR